MFSLWSIATGHSVTIAATVDGAVGGAEPVEKMEKSPEKQLRDRVFTWVDIAVSKIRKCSKTAFYGRDDIAPLFVSAYQRRLRQKYERKKAAEKVAAAATAS